MGTRDDILKELQAIAPKLAGLEKTNPYHLQEGYFASFQNALIDKIILGEVGAELKAIAPELVNVEKPGLQGVPAGYFTNFSSKLLGDIRAREVLNELREIAPELAKAEKINVQQAPATYFSEFPQSLMEKIKAAPALKSTGPSWVEKLNEALDRIASVVFRPRYTAAFSGSITLVFIGALMFMKIQQCNDLDCRFAQLSTDEINNYLENKTDAYSDEVFEGNFDNIKLPAGDKDNLRGFKEALKDVDDASLDAAIAN